MSDNLPPLPDWLQLTNDEVRSRVRAYGQQCRQQALEQVVRMLMAEHEHSWHLHNYALVYVNKVRALMKDKP